jgi:hypothetical protein
MAIRILLRRDYTSQWTSVNPILKSGEIGIEICDDGNRKLKLGNDINNWNTLPYLLDRPISIDQFLIHTNNVTDAHGATSVPTADKIAKYNADSGLQSDKVPTDDTDVVRKLELDTEVDRAIDREDTIELELTQEAARAISGEVILREDLTSEINNRIADVSGAIYISSEDATNKADAAKQYADGLVIATQVWLPAVQTVNDLLDNPGDRTYLCRVMTGSDYGVYQWIGTEETPEWTYFSDNLDFIDRIANPVIDNLPIITSDGELIDSGQSISGITNLINAKEPSKYVAVDATAAQTYSTANPTIMVFYPEV